ncbi:hypothetical protein OF829_00255 [Sphingomonas sp. LB-2]|uniref:hypothetical protein n=1 Tax=Sphingomonas caeni TaxID=2984949 RepID=UPI00222F2822|nr:hypothetical protein [Sphingomonas caeni]MCW3845653.1 hypothetical protein [Sphingomonas caeni]
MGIWLRNLRGRHYSFFATIFLLLAATLLIGGSVRRGYLTLELFRANKDAIAAIGSVATMIFLLLGGVFSYYRFFRGRTFSVRAEMSISVDIIASPNGDLLHAISVIVKNIGSNPIWNPRATLTLESRSGDRVTTTRVSDWVEESVADDTDRVAVIDAGETTTFFATRLIAKEVWAVTYVVQLASDSGDIWMTSRTLANHVAQQKESG